MFNLVSGTHALDRGEIEFDGQPIHGLPPHRIAELGLVRTFQNLQVFNSMTVLENVMVGRHIRSQTGFLSAALRLPRVAAEVDRGLAQLIRDLRARGMLERTLVVCMGEFGRTPTINKQAGRDHWPKTFSVLLAGSGIQGGRAIGRTNDNGTDVADRPVIGWVSEQGPTKEWALATMKHFAWVAVNARVELPFYRAALPGVKLSYLPFGCAWRTDEELTSRPQYLADFVADGSCHYLCGEYGGWKKPSVDVMVRPLLDQDIALWGHAPDRCGWKGVPGAAGKYRGAYAPVEHAQVYTSSKVYLGISWNWSLGGYGIKLARALGAGICTMWHRTVGMELDGIIPGVHLVAPGTAEETRAEGLRLLGDSEARQTIAAAGRAFALAHWEWGANLKRLIDDVHHGREERP